MLVVNVVQAIPPPRAGINFTVFFIVNAILWHQDSDGAGAFSIISCHARNCGASVLVTLLLSVIVPFGSMFAVIALWLGVSLPLTFIGAYSG